MTVGKGASREKIEYPMCAANYITQDHVYLLQLYNHYKDKFLPLPGGILQQPAIFIQAVNIIKSEVAKIEEEERAKTSKRR